VRWIKEPKVGEQRLGIQFFHQSFKLYKGVLMGTKDDDNLMRSWPVLIKPGKQSHTAAFPDSKIYKNMAFMLMNEGKGAHFKVIEILKKGPNYSFCKIVPAEELASGKLDFNKG